MALSGSFNSNNSGLDGVSHITVSWSATQNYGANTSTISATMTLVLKAGTSLSATENGNITIAGNVFGFSHGSTSRGPGGSYTITTAGLTIGHNSDGTQSFSMSGTFTSGFGSFGTVSGSGSWALDTIPRYANITTYTQSPVTDEEVQLNWAADATCDYVSWWSVALDGGGHHDIPVTPSTGTFVQTFHNLVSNAPYDFTVAVRRQDSGLWTTSGTANVTTLSQNGYFNTMGL